MKNRYTLLLVLLWLPLLAGAQFDHRLTPIVPGDHHAMGREYLLLANGDITVELGYDGLFHRYYVFDVVVANETSETLRIDPSQFQYYLLEDPAETDPAMPPFASVSAENILASYDMDLERQTSEKSMNSVFGFIEGGLGILASASAFAATDDPVFLLDAIFGTLGTAGHYVSQDQAIQARLEAISEEREQVSVEIFRNQELPPGKAAAGYVFFPEFEQDSYLMFQIPVRNQIFQFVYTQGNPDQ